MGRAIAKKHLKQLQPLEAELKRLVKLHQEDAAELVFTQIQKLLQPYGVNHPRLLECRLWYFESQFDANHIANAESGFTGIVARASRSSRLRVEALMFLGLCYLRQKRTRDAKAKFKEVFQQLDKIKSTQTRQLFQKRVIERIEQECLLTAIIGVEEGPMKPERILQEAEKLAEKSADEIVELLARNLPYGSVQLLNNVRNDAILQLRDADRKLLAAPEQASRPAQIGNLVFSVLKRVGWKTFCDPESPIYKLWSKKIPKELNHAYFASSIVQSFNNWKIGLPLLAAGVVAIAMKYTAQEFCELTKPGSIMDTRRKRA
jgi:hypothetical protein